MKLFVVYAHPGKESFTRRVLDEFVKGALSKGHEVKISDLYQQGFDPVMSPEEYDRESRLDAERPVSPQVAAEQEKILWADAIAFVYPVWWDDVPAILKGWFDRVFTVGFAYGVVYSELPIEPLKKAFVLCPAGNSLETLERNGLYQSMRKVMLEDRISNRAKEKDMLVLDNLNDRSEENIARKLQMAYRAGENI